MITPHSSSDWKRLSDMASSAGTSPSPSPAISMMFDFDYAASGPRKLSVQMAASSDPFLHDCRKLMVETGLANTDEFRCRAYSTLELLGLRTSNSQVKSVNSGRNFLVPLRQRTVDASGGVMKASGTKVLCTDSAHRGRRQGKELDG
ncbi:unnamed protein product [Gongylonema pulchrum]|uniref:Uncharacterized protein n=1 Tax=Gongylonema pulchrum TaxID=637853 RepID=A0A3P6SEH5_9BILA|nr:unnamed protein product [Gongylonema pulchrum]